MCKPIRVLHVVPSLAKDAGVTSVVYNLTHFSDPSRVRYDFLHHDVVDGRPRHVNVLDGEFESLGCKIYRVNHASADLPRFIKEVHGIVHAVGSTYDIIHCHMPNSAFCVLREAKQVGMRIRILHSHLNTSSDRLSHRIRNAPLIAVGRFYANDYLACSEDAGNYLFKSAPFMVIRNGIDLSKYSYNQSVRDNLRRKLSISRDARVIGCVGRFSKQKNFSFAIRIFSEYSKLDSSSRMVIVGGGEEEYMLKKLVADLQIDKKVIFSGIRNDVEQFYSLFDCLFMPSLYEGLPVTAVEAQAAGLPCLYSANVPEETDIVGSGLFLPLEEPTNKWVSALMDRSHYRRVDNAINNLESAGYSAQFNAELMMQHYEKLMIEDRLLK